jgi:hypothetical protein
MDNTCNYEKCEFAKVLMFSSPHQCPNYIESLWVAGPMTGNTGSQPKLVCDCSPKRVFLMIQELYNRQIGTQQALEQVRNEIQYTEVVADVIGKNLGIDLEKLVAERQRLLNIQKIREIATAQEEQKKITEKTE